MSARRKKGNDELKKYVLIAILAFAAGAIAGYFANHKSPALPGNPMKDVVSENYHLFRIASYKVNDKCCFVVDFFVNKTAYEFNACPLNLNEKDREVLKNRYSVNPAFFSYFGTKYYYTVPVPEQSLIEEFGREIIPKLEPYLDYFEARC